MKKLNIKKPSWVLQSILPLLKEVDLYFDEISFHQLGLIYATGKTTEKEIDLFTEKLNDKESDILVTYLDSLSSFQRHGVNSFLIELDFLDIKNIDAYSNCFNIALCINIECLINTLECSIHKLKKMGL